jgi:hypothetical protein
LVVVVQEGTQDGDVLEVSAVVGKLLFDLPHAGLVSKDIYT